MKILIVGNVHGRFNSLLKIVEEVKKKHDIHDIIFTGDLIHKGTSNLKILRYIKDNNYSFLLGDHELMFLREFLENSRTDKFHFKLSKNWDKVETGSFTFTNEMKDKKEILGWIDFIEDNFKYEIEIDNVLITHAPIIKKWDFMDLNEKENFVENSNLPNLIRDKITVYSHTNSTDYSWMENGKLDKVNYFKNKKNLVNFNKREKLNIHSSIGINTADSGLCGIWIDTQTLEFEVVIVKESSEKEFSYYKDFLGENY